MRAIKYLSGLLQLLAIAMISSCGKSGNTKPKTTDSTTTGATTVTVTTFVGNGGQTNADGTGTAANIYTPANMTMDAAGNLFVTEQFGVGIHKVTPLGVVTTPAQFQSEVSGIALDAKENYYVGGYNTQAFYEVSPSGTSRIAITPGGYYAQNICVDGAGNVFMITQGIGNVYKANASGGDPAIYAQVPSTLLSSVVADSKGTLFVASHSAIYKITTAGTVTLFAGAESLNTGGTNGAEAAEFGAGISNIAVDANDNLYVTDFNLNQVMEVTAAGKVSVLAGSTTYATGAADGVGSNATFNYPDGIAVTSDGKTIYVADHFNSLIRKLTIK